MKLFWWTFFVPKEGPTKKEGPQPLGKRKSVHSSTSSPAAMLPAVHRLKKAAADNPKKLASLIDLANLPSPLRDFLGQSQCSRLTCFNRVWSYIKTNNLQVPSSIHSFNLIVLSCFFFGCLFDKVGGCVGFMVGGGLDGLILGVGGVCSWGWDWWLIA